ncbi:tripartite tricarboxylate transporter substrate-binding protein, partial [Chloroflexota bacterium]
MRRFMFSLILGLVLVLTVVAGACAPASQAAADFYKDNTVELIVSMREGGGVDTASRVLASYWAEVTGGTMVVKNMPGGGNLVGSNYVYGTKPDGLTIGATMLTEFLAAPQIFGVPGVEFDINQISWVADAIRYDSAFGFSTSTKTPYKTIADLKNAPRLITGCQTPAASM